MLVLPLILAALLSAASPALAQPRDAATDDRLDPMLAARDWKGLETVLTQPAPLPTRVRQLNWLQRQVDRGGNFYVAQFYAQNLWAMAQADPKRANLRQTASEMLLYAAALVRVDGAVCADGSAPDRRLQQVLRWQAPVLRATRAVPQQRKAAAVAAAIALERKTAPRRQAQDETLCQGGDAGLLAGLEAAGATFEIIPTPGQTNSAMPQPRQLAITPPRGGKPSFRQQRVYQPEQVVIRRHLPQTLAVIAK
jgi:hypothetical protein